MKNCKWCHNDFVEEHSQQVCCSRACKRRHLRDGFSTQFNNMNGSSGVKGAIQELKVCSDLLMKGYSVFRSVSPNCPCDLIIMDKEGKLKRVEVRSALKLKSGKLSYSKAGHYDIIAGVFGDDIQYIKNLTKWNP